MYTIAVYDGSVMGRATIADALEVALQEMIGNHGYEVEVFDTLTNTYLFRFERKFKYHYISRTGVIANDTIEATIYPALADAIVAEQNRLTDEDLLALLAIMRSIVTQTHFSFLEPLQLAIKLEQQLFSGIPDEILANPHG